jgi:hypothetical protein
MLFVNHLSFPRDHIDRRLDSDDKLSKKVDPLVEGNFIIYYIKNDIESTLRRAESQEYEGCRELKLVSSVIHHGSLRD